MSSSSFSTPNPPRGSTQADGAQRKKRSSAQSLRRFGISWIGAILLAFALLTGGSTYAMRKLRGKSQRMAAASESLSNSHLFELTVLSAARQHELWRVTGGDAFHKGEMARLDQASSILRQLHRQAEVGRESDLTGALTSQFAAFQLMSAQKNPDVGVWASVGDDLLETIRQHRVLNENRVQTMLQSSENLDRMMNTISMSLVAIAALIVIAGSLVLWSRIFKPILALTRAASEFGAGDLQARTPIMREDEMGKLAETFNGMAAAIADREKERLHFVATVAHDLRNPLVVIGGAAHLLKNKGDNFPPEDRAHWLGIIGNNTRKLESQIFDLTDSVQVETGQLTLQTQTLDLSELASEVVADHAAACGSHSLSCEAPAPCPICGDRKRLERVVSNLVSNAIKYSPSKTEVSIVVKIEKGQGVLLVADQGAGISPEELKTLFVPFARSERTRDMAQGTGLGLSSVKKIVEAHDGTIQVSSQIDKGTIVEVRLPLAIGG